MVASRCAAAAATAAATSRAVNRMVAATAGSRGDVWILLHRVSVGVATAGFYGERPPVTSADANTANYIRFARNGVKARLTAAQTGSTRHARHVPAD